MIIPIIPHLQSLVKVVIGTEGDYLGIVGLTMIPSLIICVGDYLGIAGLAKITSLIIRVASSNVIRDSKNCSFLGTLILHWCLFYLLL